MKLSFFGFYVTLASGGQSAQTSAWQPSPGHTQMPIWPSAVPDAQPAAGPEVAETAKDPIAGKLGDFVVNVSLSKGQ
jgi:hypothetical protein